MRIGSTGHRNTLRLEVGDSLDVRVFARHQRRPFGLGINVHRLDRIAVVPANKRGRARASEPTRLA